jgi:adenosylmethionine-8-amino-7-oxononanoate aminotransferase
VLIKTLKHPESSVLLRKWDRALPMADRAEGVYIFDRSGRKYLDASGGAFVVNIGHAVKPVTEAIKKQLDAVSYLNGTQFACKVADDLASRLLKYAPKGFSKVSFLSSGSEAVEAALKFARQYYYDLGEEKRAHIIARTPGYHGNTMLALSISGRPRYQKFFGPLMHPALQVPAPQKYRCPVDWNSEAGDYYFSFIEKAVQSKGADKILSLIIEPVGGSSTGGQVPPPGYHKKIRDFCTKHGIFLIADEVLCGCGRTGTFLASTLDDLNPDAIVLGKGLNGGFVPLSAVLFKEEHLKVLEKNSGPFMHAQTYMLHPVACAAGLAVLEYIEENNLLEAARDNGRYLKSELDKKILSHPNVGNVQGIGMLYGIELVKDKATKESFGVKEKVWDKFSWHAQESEGLITWPNSGNQEDERGDIICIAPPLTITRTEIDDLVIRFERALDSYFKKKS